MNTAFPAVERFHRSLSRSGSLSHLQAMEIPAALVVLPLGVLFISSGLIINIIQAVLFVLVRPLSKNAFRRLNNVVMDLLWSELIWLFDWWACVKVELYAEQELLESMGKESALFICNHRSDIDWLVGWVLAQRAGVSTTAVMKKALQFLPVIGWAMYFSDYIPLERSWAKDETNLKSGFEQLKDFPMPFWLGMFPEGTRFTQQRLQKAQEFAASAGLPIPKHVLIPRTKGFVSAVSDLRAFVPAIYNATLAVPKTQPAPTLLRLLKGQSSTIHVHLERFLMQELPETDTGIAQWCRDIFSAKDALLAEHLAKDTFLSKEMHDIGRPKKSLFIFISWACLLTASIILLFQKFPFLFSWIGFTFLAAFLAMASIVMHVFVMVSKPDDSAPEKISPRSAMREQLLPK